MTSHLISSLEILEARIAPASLAGQVLTYTDIDGDHVSVTISKGTLLQGNFTFNVANPFTTNATAPMQLQGIDIHSDAMPGGANITIKVAKAGGGDGLAAIGAINATGIDLGTVTIPGDLGFIDAGSNGASNIAIKALSVRTIGLYGTATQASGSPSLTSLIQGHLGSLTLKGDLAPGVTFNVSDSTAANSGIGAITIGGSLLGTLESAGGGMGLLTVKGSILGGVVTEDAGPIAGLHVFGSVVLNSGVVAKAGSIGPVTLGGSLYNGSAIESLAGTIGSVKIGGSIYGQSALLASGNIGAVTLGGSLSNSQISATGTGGITSVAIGGSMVDDGVIQTNSGKLGNVTVKGAVEDGSGLATTSGDIGKVTIGSNFQTSSQIVSGGMLGAVTIGGSALANIGAANGIASVSVHGELSAQIVATGGAIGAVTVGGDVAGALLSSAGTLGAVKVTGVLTQSSIVSVGSIASITVGKNVTSSQILAGTSALSASAVNFGAVKVGGDWIASNLSAGVGGTMGNYGDSTDTQLALSSKITSIAIAGIISGAPGSQNHFGFDAETIGSFTYDGIKLKLPTTFPADPIPLAPILGDVAIELTRKT
jgi:hypothetical protein